MKKEVGLEYLIEATLSVFSWIHPNTSSSLPTPTTTTNNNMRAVLLLVGLCLCFGTQIKLCFTRVSVFNAFAVFKVFSELFRKHLR